MAAPRLFIVSDFDGTITERDTLDLVVNRYAPEVWQRVERLLVSGDMDLVEAMHQEFAAVKATEEEVLTFVLTHAGLRAGFAAFVQWVGREGHRLVVVSAGFRVLIDAVLAHEGLHGLHVHAGDALFTSEGTAISFPPSTMECARACGHCKSETIAAHGPFAGPVVYIGDGYSDRCAAREADIVFAREGLAAYLDEIGVAYHPFDSFDDVRRVLEELGRR